MELKTGEKFKFAHIFYESKPPYGLRIVVLNEDSLQKAREQYYPLLPDYAKCKQTGYWPGYTQNIDEIALPAFAGVVPEGSNEY